MDKQNLRKEINVYLFKADIRGNTGAHTRTLNRAVMFIPGGPCELNTPLPLVRQLQVSRRVGSLWRKSSTHRNINTHTDIYRISKGSCNKKKKKKKKSRRSWGFFSEI